MESVPIWVWVVGLVAFIIVGGMINARLQSGQRKKLMDLAAARGFSFEQKDNALEKRLNSFSMFAKFLGDVRNVLRKQVEGGVLSVFQYRYKRGKARHTRVYATFEPRGRTLSAFSLRHEKILEFSNDIDFESHQEFSRKYHLKADDEAGVRALFDLALLSALERDASDPWVIECRGDLLAIRRAIAVPRKPQEIFDFAEKAGEICRLLMSS